MLQSKYLWTLLNDIALLWYTNDRANFLSANALKKFLHEVNENFVASISTLSHFLSSGLIKFIKYSQKQKDEMIGSSLTADKEKIKECDLFGQSICQISQLDKWMGKAGAQQNNKALESRQKPQKLWWNVHVTVPQSTSFGM